MKAAIYCRLSEEDRNKQNETDDSGSIQNQKNMLLQYCAGQGWDVYHIYSDDDYAGADRKRPQFNLLLEDAEQHKFDIVLCKTQSRFTRELELVEKYIHGLFPLWGIRFVSIVDNADTANRGNKKSRQINGLVNEWYLEDMSDNIRSVLTSRRKDGLHIGAFALYGYEKNPAQKGRLVIDEEAAAVVREVFLLFARGYGKTAIARLLNDRGIPNPAEYKRLHGLRFRPPASKNSTLWRYSTISSMLRNEIYIGNMVQGRYGSVSYKTKQNRPRPKDEWYIVPGTHEPIIDRALWDRVQALLREKAKPFASGAVGLFAQKARCANCGYCLRSSKTSAQSGGRCYLKCPTHSIAKDACAGAFISVSKLEQAVLGELKRLSAEYLNLDELERRVHFGDRLQEQKKKLLQDRAAYEKRIAEYAKGLRELYLDKVRGLITERDFTALSKEFTAEKARFEYAAAEVQRQIEAAAQQILAGESRRTLIERCVNTDRLTRELVEALIDYVAVGKRIPGTREVPIEIHWAF